MACPLPIPATQVHGVGLSACSPACKNTQKTNKKKELLGSLFSLCFCSVLQSGSYRYNPSRGANHQQHFIISIACANGLSQFLPKKAKIPPTRSPLIEGSLAHVFLNAFINNSALTITSSFPLPTSVICHLSSVICHQAPFPFTPFSV